MSASQISEPQRLCLTLDPGLVMERLILRRFSRLKRKRGHDWLRSLLVQGFLAEGRWIRSEDGNSDLGPRAASIPTTPFANWLEHTQIPSQNDAERAAAAQPVTASPGQADEQKPFAHLRKVIG